ncbi:DNA topoisomerase I, mitochondrial-like [Daphnia pulicaria]|uniref:DNA topoisomerase I, mitochondrial-like n=1 Tax=Daphnia pulicaria TaxID=35523 RepID=UPI001EEC200B|nr:DNA topoisomerase I, mitochondrial-like [Daphnia pulicaria]
MGSAEVDKHTPPSGDGAGKDMLTGLSNGMDRHKSKDKDHHSHKHKHKDKDREKSKDKSRDKHKDKHKDKHRDKDKHKDKSKDKDRKHDKEERSKDRKHSKEDRKVEKEEKKKGKDKSKDKAEKSQYVEVKNEPLSEDDDVPLASRSFSQTSQDSEDDDQPLAFRQKVKPEVKAEVKAEKPVKRKAEVLDDDDFSASKKKTKKVKEEKKEKANKKPATPNGSPTKRAKKEKEEEETWKWWEEEKHEDGVKWKSLEHKGPVFATQYEPLPGNVKFKYNGQEMKLSTAAEEVGSFYAAMLDHDYVTKDVFNKNFFKDWRKFMTHSEKEIITDLKKCDFTYMLTYFKAKSEERKNRTKEEKLKLKSENEEMVKEYGWCIIDGHKQRIGNFKIEPPGLFRGRGDHPKMGMVKRRVIPEDVIINCTKGTAPKPPPGHKWKEVRSDNTVTWLASWTENVQGQVKYIMLNSASRLKGEKDWQKYEIARQLKDSVDKIRETYKEDWKSKEMKIRQRSVALYFIDKLALRAGNEKDEDQADTVGACSLRVEHISLHEQKEGKQCVVVFDFLGKDSIRYYNEVPVEKRVFKNLQIFMENKKPGDDLFDRLNTTIMNKHLNDLMEGLTAKVFRTFNASNTLQEQLDELTDPKSSVTEKILAYNRANRAVAILCNHQRAVPKTFAKSMENLQVKITTKREAIEDAEKSFKDLKKEAKKTGSAAAKIAAGKKEKQVEKLKEQLMKLEVQATDREENKEIALGTSKLNYLDPRISVAWCKKNDVPIEKIYNKTQREKFQWAIDMAGPEFVF